MNLSERQGLIQDILDNPDDDTPRLIYADWLDDNELEGSKIIHAGLENPNYVWSYVNGHTINCPINGVITIPCNHTWTFRRGFLEKVVCPINDWIYNGPGLVKVHPITKLELTDKEPEATTDQKQWYWFPHNGILAVGHKKHRLSNHIHNWMITNKCGRKGNVCWTSKEEAYYALILWAKAFKHETVESIKAKLKMASEVPHPT